MKDDFSPLTDSGHYLDWIGGDPAASVRSEIERMLHRQVPDSKLEWVRLLGKPEFLTGGREVFDDPGKLILTRAALAVSFELQVKTEKQTEQLRGVFSWTATGLGAVRDDRCYLDLDAELPWAATMLKSRIYELTDSPPNPFQPQRKRWWQFR